MQLIARTLLLFAVLALAACGGTDDTANGGAAGDEATSLPKPETSGGSMPRISTSSSSLVIKLTRPANRGHSRDNTACRRACAGGCTLSTASAGTC